jgi:hypothetical protein
MYEKGQGVAQDYQQARSWYDIAARQNFASAQTNLGLLYFNGQGVTRDYQKAYFWFSLAKANGAGSEALELVTDKLNLDEISEVQEQAREWRALHGN